MISKKRNLDRVPRVNAGVTYVEPEKVEIETRTMSVNDDDRLTMQIGDVIGPRKSEVFSGLFK